MNRDDIAAVAGTRDQPQQPARTDRPGETGRAGSDDLTARLARLADNHPSSPRYPADKHPGAPGDHPDRKRHPDHKPLDDHAYAAHTRFLEERLEEAKARGLATDRQCTIGPDRKAWTKERVDAQREIVNDLYAAASEVPRDGKAVIAGGIGGAGKTTVLDTSAQIDRSQFLTINPDRIKEELARRGMIPVVEGLSPMERSVLVHEESSLVARRLASRALADRKNVIWDITMSSRSTTERRVNELRAAGYQEVTGVFVDIPVEKSVERVLDRHRRGLESYRAGEGMGGRYVPPEVIRGQQTSDGGTVNRKVFEELRPRFDRWQLYDNSRDEPVLVQASDHHEEPR